MPDIAALQSAAIPQPLAQQAPTDHHVLFHEILSALNPLQYLPVVGTIYRAVSGDQIPEAVRRIGSFIVSAVVGGPIGAAINVAVMVAEKITGVDLDQTGQSLLAAAGHTALPAPTVAAAATVPAPPPASAPPAVATAAQEPEISAAATLTADAELPVQPASIASRSWSPAQLAAYGVSTARDGGLRLADLNGADVLNALELLRIRGAEIAYGRTVGLAG